MACTQVYVIDDKNVYGFLDLCAPITTTTTSTTTAAPTTTSTTTSTTTAAPTTTSTTTSTTTAAIVATVDFSWHNDGAGSITIKSQVTSGTTLDSLAWSGNGRGYESLGCTGVTHDQAFSDTLGAGGSQISTEVWNVSTLVLSATTLSLTVGGTIIGSSNQVITVSGHNYLITGAGNCNSPLPV